MVLSRVRVWMFDVQMLLRKEDMLRDDDEERDAATVSGERRRQAEYASKRVLVTIEASGAWRVKRAVKAMQRRAGSME